VGQNVFYVYDTALSRCVYHDREGASPHLLLYYYDTACLNPPGIYRSRVSTAAPSGTTATHTRFAHKILLNYIIICMVYLPSAVISYYDSVFSIFPRCLIPAPRGYSSAMSRLPWTRRGSIFSLLLFILLLFMNGCPEDDLKI